MILGNSAAKREDLMIEEVRKGPEVMGEAGELHEGPGMGEVSVVVVGAAAAGSRGCGRGRDEAVGEMFDAEAVLEAVVRGAREDEVVGA